uniref:M-phase inducer phosphatase 1-B-like n=1 Tax=Oncorhynchus gorbuscha TaxID=8017 RepID=UPI001EAF6B5A|nr:M-phase inducer phosphatase 1-B-like [Oncorhynchus gorbuscha]
MPLVVSLVTHLKSICLLSLATDIVESLPMDGYSLSMPGPHSPDYHASPMSELANCFTGLRAFHTGDTPRRCLDLSNLSSGSVEDAAAQGSPHKDKPTSPVALDSPAPSRMKTLRSFLPRLLCSSPKLHPSERPFSNKENVAPGQRAQGKPECLLPAPDSQLQGDGEPCALGSPIFPAPPSRTQHSPGDADGFMEILEQETDEGSIAVAMSCSMAQLLSDPLMNQEVDLSSVSVCRQGGRRLFRSPSMPERLARPLKRSSTSPSPANPRPIKRHCTFSAVSEEVGQGEGDQGAGINIDRKHHLHKRTHSLCDVEQQLGGDGINAELIGDFSKVHALPTVTGRHQGLKYITVDTMSALLEGKFSCLVESFVVVDCRYPYEYQGGHIKGALSLPNTDKAVDQLLSQRLKAHSPDKRLVLVLHCEFSSERAPRTCHLLRSVDRSMNEYPALHYPELYVLKGGYRDFYHSHQEHCEPQAYCPMHHEDHREELLRCRTHSRALAEERRRRHHIQTLVKL